eukprot:g17877.t1
MPRDHAQADAAAHAPRRARRLSLSMGTSTRRPSGATRTFRDPIEAEDIYRRWSSPDSSSGVPSGATQTFRDPAIRDMAAMGRRESSPPTTSGRRESLREWLAKKTPTSFVKETEQLDGGGNQDEAAELSCRHKVHPEFDSPAGDGFLGDGKEDLWRHSPSTRKVDPTLEDSMLVRHENNDNLLCGGLQGEVMPTITGSLSHGRGRDNIITAVSDGHQNPSEAELVTQAKYNDGAGIKEGIFDDSSPRSSNEGVAPRQVTFLSGTMGLTVDIGDPTQPQPQPQPPDELWQERTPATAATAHGDFPASPCSGVILETSPRYGRLQIFRKEMSYRGMNGQMFHTGWRGSLLPPRDIRLFLTDSRKQSVLYWRYRKKNTRGRGGGEELGAEDRRVVPLSSLANIGLAEVYHKSNSMRGQGRLPSWLPLPFSRKRKKGGVEAGNRKTTNNEEAGSLGKPGPGAGSEEVPVLALSYWVNGVPRWVGDQPKRFLVKPDSLDAFRSLTRGLRLCCLHFHNHSCPQDIEDVC